MMNVIPFFCALTACAALASCGHTAPDPMDEVPIFAPGISRTGGLPQQRNPVRDLPEVRAWHGHMPLVMGVDSACSLPVVVFPELASRCPQRGPREHGFPTAPIRISLEHGREPIVAYSHVVSPCGAPVQGLIGWPVARRYVWHLDLPRQRHEFHKTLPSEVRGMPRLRLEEGDVARVRLPGCGGCVLDTGAPYGLYLSRQEWRRFLAANPGVEVETYCGVSPAAGGLFILPCARVAHMQLGPLHLRDIHVCESYSPLTGPRMLGREALVQFDIWVDGPDRWVYYRPVPPQD